MSERSVCDPRYGTGEMTHPGAGGPYAAGKGWLITDGVSAFLGAERRTLPRAPRRIVDTLRPLMVRARGGIEVLFADLMSWLGDHFPGCGDCRAGFVPCDHPHAEGKMVCPDCEGDGEMACVCTARRAIVGGVPVFGWHVHRQLSHVGHEPGMVRLAALEVGRGFALQVSCPAWVYVRLGLLDIPGQSNGTPRWPDVVPFNSRRQGARMNTHASRRRA